MHAAPSAEATLVSASGDGIAPALLLTIRSGRQNVTPVQYLVNIPEGFARLVLEHRCRPGLGLRAAVLTDTSQAALGGLGGLLLRLRQDGHSALRLVGPPGVRDVLEGLSSFVRWTHPAVDTTAVTVAQQGCVYDDELLEVRPLWTSSLLWEVPAWLRPPGGDAAPGGGGAAAVPAAPRAGTVPATAAASAEAAAAAGEGGSGAAASLARKRARVASAAAAGQPAPAQGAAGRREVRVPAPAAEQEGTGGGGSDPLASLKRSILAATTAAAALPGPAPARAPAAAYGTVRGGAQAVAVSVSAPQRAAAPPATAIPGPRGVMPGAMQPSASSGEESDEAGPGFGSCTTSASSSSTSGSEEDEGGAQGGGTRGAVVSVDGGGEEGAQGEARKGLAGACSGDNAAPGRESKRSGSSESNESSESSESSERSSSGGGESSGKESSSSQLDERKSSKSSASSSTDTDTDSESDSTDSDEGGRTKHGRVGGGGSALLAKGTPRRAGPSAVGTASTAAAAPPAASHADLFQSLDRLFMAAAASAPRGMPPGARGGGRAERGVGGRGCGGAKQDGRKRGGRNAGGADTVASAPLDAAIRSEVMQQLRSVAAAASPPSHSPQLRPAAAGSKASTSEGRHEPGRSAAGRADAIAAAPRRAQPPASAAATAPRRAAPAIPVPAGAAATPGAMAAAPKPGPLPPPLGYLLYLKPLRQALLVAAPCDAAAAASLARHAAVQLLAAAAAARKQGPGAPPHTAAVHTAHNVMAVVHLAPPDVSRCQPYRRLVRQLRGVPSLWPARHEHASGEQRAGAGAARAESGAAGGERGVRGDMPAAAEPAADGRPGVGDACQPATDAMPSAAAAAAGEPGSSAPAGEQGEAKQAGHGGITREAVLHGQPDASTVAAAGTGAERERAGADANGDAADAPTGLLEAGAQKPASLEQQPCALSKAQAPPSIEPFALGHIASCRVTARLNAVAPGIFPLPFALRTPVRSNTERSTSGGSSGGGGRAPEPGAAPAAVAVAPRAQPPVSSGLAALKRWAAARLPALTCSLVPVGAAGAAASKAACRPGKAGAAAAHVPPPAVITRSYAAGGSGVDGAGGGNGGGGAGGGVVDVQQVQAQLLLERGASGLTHMLQALHAACPELASAAQASRLLRGNGADGPQRNAATEHAASQPERATLDHEGIAPSRGDQQLGTEGAVPGAVQSHMVGPLSHAVARPPVAGPPEANGWGPWGWHGTGAPYSAAASEAAAAAELAAVAAAYGAEQLGRVMRPLYANGASSVRYSMPACAAPAYPPPGAPLGSRPALSPTAPWAQSWPPYSSYPNAPGSYMPAAHMYGGDWQGGCPPPLLHVWPPAAAAARHSAPQPAGAVPWHWQQQQQPMVQQQPWEGPWARPPELAAARDECPLPPTVPTDASAVREDAIAAAPAVAEAACGDNRQAASRLRQALKARSAVNGAAGQAGAGEGADASVSCASLPAGSEPGIASSPNAAAPTPAAAGAVNSATDDNRAVARRVRQRLRLGSSAPAVHEDGAGGGAGAGQGQVGDGRPCAEPGAQPLGGDGEAAMAAEAPAAGAGQEADSTSTATADTHEANDPAARTGVKASGLPPAELQCPAPTAAANRSMAALLRSALQRGRGGTAVESTTPLAAAAGMAGEAAADPSLSAAANPCAATTTATAAASVERVGPRPVAAVSADAAAAAVDALTGAELPALEPAAQALVDRFSAQLANHTASRSAAATAPSPSAAAGPSRPPPPAGTAPPGITAARSTPAQQHPAGATPGALDDAPPPACLRAPGAATTCVLFLGTGSAEPSKFRGASGILLRGLGPHGGSALIDAGEASFGALVRWLGPAGAAAQAAALRLVWLSHKHPDHVLGLPALLERRPASSPPLLVVGPREVAHWLAKVAPLHPGWRFTFVHCADFRGSWAGSVAETTDPRRQAGAAQPYPATAAASALAAQPQLAPGQLCPCCPPIGRGPPVTPAAAADGFGVDEYGNGSPRHAAGPSATARMRWHQQRRAFGAVGAAAPQQLPAASAPHYPISMHQPPPPQEQHGGHYAPQGAQRQGRGAAAETAAAAAAAAAQAAVCGAALGLSRWQSVAVHHCRDAWGLVLEHSEGWKLVYSGDTRPSPALVAAGRGATLLLHEATFEPCLEAQARAKRHCTSAEAAEVAAGMDAYRTVLTHFSQRYPRVPAGLDPWATPLRARPVPAFDGMLLPLAALPALPLLMPALALALGEAQSEQQGQEEKRGGV